MSDLSVKVKSSIRLIKSAANAADSRGGSLELAYSGGKDSEVMLHLAGLAGVHCRPIHKLTGIDHPATVQWVRSHNVEVFLPKINFFEGIESYGFPFRTRRWCCRFLKEYKVEDFVLIGVRQVESKERAARYREPHQCRFFRDRSYVQAFYPLLFWSNDDIFEFVKSERLPLNPLYYDSHGSLINARVGCIGCPLASKQVRRSDFVANPKMLREWLRHGSIFLKKHPSSFYDSSYDVMYSALFCSSKYHFYRQVSHGVNTRLFFESYFGPNCLYD